MLIVATIGLGVNLAGMRLLSSAAGHTLNVRGVYLEVLSDTLGSLGVIAAGLIILKTGWYLADPIIGAAIGLFIIPRTWTLLKQAVHVLMEGVPAHIDLGSVEAAMCRVPGVQTVHDLHVWTLTSGLDAMSAHVIVGDPGQACRVLRDLVQVLRDEFGIEHTTIQIETSASRRSGAASDCPQAPRLTTVRENRAEPADGSGPVAVTYHTGVYYQQRTLWPTPSVTSRSC